MHHLVLRKNWKRGPFPIVSIFFEPRRRIQCHPTPAQTSATTILPGSMYSPPPLRCDWEAHHKCQNYPLKQSVSFSCTEQKNHGKEFPFRYYLAVIVAVHCLACCGLLRWNLDPTSGTFDRLDEIVLPLNAGYSLTFALFSYLLYVFAMY